MDQQKPEKRPDPLAAYNSLMMAAALILSLGDIQDGIEHMPSIAAQEMPLLRICAERAGLPDAAAFVQLLHDAAQDEAEEDPAYAA